ncbi:MAG TPA: type II toxin-antitoxin system RelE/ParE family toxin [Candidatus Kapabacteria bacterium]|nr:type II toxin-antitoxin system RelE/ParE family toxin [Candidatus Kapabacteria bacterium]
MPASREVYFFKSYFLEFYHEQQPDVRAKIKRNLKIVREIDPIHEQFLKHIREGIYEVRVSSGRKIFRIFCCFDEGNIIVLFHGFQKKTEQTPTREIDRALRIQREYREAKAKGEIADLIGRAP